MGLFSKSTTVQQTAVTNFTDASNVGTQVGDGSAIVLRGDNSSIELIDAGAINSAFGFAERNASSYADAASQLLSSAERVNLESQNNVYALARDNASGLMSFAEDVLSLSREAQSNVASLARENASDLRTFAQFQTASDSSRIVDLVKLGVGALATVFVVRAWLARGASRS